MTTKDGGSAFPLPVAVDHMDGVNYGPAGMSLRDYFAGQALASTDPPPWLSPGDRAISYERWAACCYEMADAMLKAREQ